MTSRRRCPRTTSTPHCGSQVELHAESPQCPADPRGERPATLGRCRSEGEGGEGGVGDVGGKEVEDVVEVGDRAGLAELVDADGEGALAEDAAEPGEGVAGGVVDGDDRRAALGRRDQRGDVEWRRAAPRDAVRDAAAAARRATRGTGGPATSGRARSRRRPPPRAPRRRGRAPARTAPQPARITCSPSRAPPTGSTSR